MRLSSTILELQLAICRKLPMLTYPTCIWHVHWGWPHLSFAEIFWIRKLESWTIVWHCLRDPAFSCFSRTPTCDRWTDR